MYSQVLIYLLLAESPFLELFSSSELIRHLTNGGFGSVSEWPCLMSREDQEEAVCVTLPLSSLSHSKYINVRDFSAFAVYLITS